MAHHQHDDQRRSALQSLLNMFHLSRTVATNTNAEDEVEGDVDEPPDERSFPFPHTNQVTARPHDPAYAKCPPPPMERKVSLITRALRSGQGSEVASPLASPVSGAFSRTSTFSNASVPSTAELTSDGDDKSPARSTSSSPLIPATHILPLGSSGKPPMPPSRISFVGDKETVHSRESHESQIEANLGRKRLITFACSEKPVITSPPIIVQEEKKVKKESGEPPKRKCMLTFACPARPSQPADHPSRRPSPRESEAKLASDKASQKDDNPSKGSIKSPAGLLATSHNDLLSPPLYTKADSAKSPEVPVFQEFDISSGDGEDWAREPIDMNHKLTLTDVMKKENAIRKLGEEAEEEAEEEAKAEEEAANELDDDLDEGENSDDFAPSDDGNESDNEAGFAESDDEVDLHPDDQFWVPDQRPITSDAVQTSYFRPTGSRRQSGSSTDSVEDDGPRHSKTTPSINIKHSKHHGASKMRPLRPSTPDLPDSTDFVCGTLDEDRPLEAAYKSCLEQRKRGKLIPIPQDIDPSFPTSDPEDMDEEDDEDLDDVEDNALPNGNIEDVGGNDTEHRLHISRRSSVISPRRPRSPVRQVVHRSPPPPRTNTRHHSPPGKGRLFGKSPRRMISPPPTGRLRSPPGTRRESSTELTPFPQLSRGLATGRLAHRPSMTGTSSLPRTPNPFFHNYRAGKHVRLRNFSDDGTPRPLHVRGPVDIVTGLETKRQKRKEKFWRQHCRKAAREQMERKTVPGRGAERMRELGLECAERNRAYGVQQSALVISI